MKKELMKEVLEKHHHMSFVCEDFMVYKRFEAFKGATNLRTLLAVLRSYKLNLKAALRISNPLNGTPTPHFPPASNH
ncbi:hypothetical protein L2E82_45111 [Cichorium intybus]|uniref:Uncharacterized protein n=1 Tax=Cichorium intybus TaxID=13427 RepID=A0ACB8ZT19_CICIN|nr:hypothetical protein L2E82_45111 [Cichorium intybus]